MSEGNMRFDAWPPVVPKHGEVVQIQVGEYKFESAVLSRGTRDGRTFRIAVAEPYSGVPMLLEITPNATGKFRIDGPDGGAPYWQTVPQTLGTKAETAQLFFLK